MRSEREGSGTSRFPHERMVEVADNSKQTWQATSAGQLVLFGVVGYPNGYLVHMQNSLDEVYQKYVKAKEIVDPLASTGRRIIFEFPEDKRGHWTMKQEEGQDYLLLELKEVGSNRVFRTVKLNTTYAMEVPEVKPKSFVLEA